MDPDSRAKTGNAGPTEVSPPGAYAIESLAPLLSMPSRMVQFLIAVGVVLAILAVTAALYAHGGVFAFAHTMYLPIIVAALVFGVRGGVMAALLGGLLLGPYMPDVTGAVQPVQNWMFRLAVFSLVGVMTGAGASTLRQQLKRGTWLQEHDALTGLLNQTGLLRKLRELVDGGAYAHLIVTVTQLRNLLEIQNTFGPHFCDALIPMVAERARRMVPPDSLLALIQHDRFAMVMTQTAHADEVRRRVEETIREPYVVNGIPVHVELSVGSAHYPAHAGDPGELLQKASIAMRWAVMHNQVVSVYDGANDRTSRDNLILLGSLPGALANDELEVWHQAKCDLRQSGAIIGTEALLRWIHPERGIIPPGYFIPQAEETALINPLTHWVIEAALGDVAAWRAHGHRLRVAINLSVRSLHDASLPGLLAECAQRHALDASDIELEITESAVMEDFDFCAGLVGRLRDAGFRVSIDDFGTGHASLAYLKRLPISSLKIDQIFVKTLATDTHNQKIVEAILQLARALGLETVAEGVEDKRALDLLQQWGCDYAQGFFIHKPAPAVELIAWLEAAAIQRKATSFR